MTTPLDISTFVYQTGSLNISPGDTTAVFSGAGLSAVIKAGDTLRVGSASAKISEVTDDTHLELFAPWDGPAVSAAPYLIIKDSPIRYDAVMAAFNTNQLLSFLDGTTVWYDVEGDEPDPSIGEDGQRAFKSNVTPWKVWLKTGGVWVLQAGSPGGQGDPGADGATWVAQTSEPATSYPVGSLWIDSDSTDLDVYQLGGSPLAWADTGINLKGAQGNPGAGVPAGGTAGQVLARDSGTGTEWIDPPASLPAGGTAGQVLTKASTTDGDANWADPSGDVAGDTHAATGKTTPVDADEFALVDSAASNVLKKLTWANLKAAFESYYDSLTATLTNKTLDTASNTFKLDGAAFGTATEATAALNAMVGDSGSGGAKGLVAAPAAGDAAAGKFWKADGSWAAPSGGGSGGAKAWVNFNGTGALAIRSSFNVSSVTDNGSQGDYTVNFSTALSNANYAAVATISKDATSTSYSTCTGSVSVNNLATGSVRILCGDNNTDTQQDGAVVSLVAFGS